MSSTTTSSRRSSTRLQQKQVKPQPPADSDSDTAVAPKPPRKKKKVSNVDAKFNASAKASVYTVDANKQKAAWAKVRGKRGQLKLVVEMPFDILLEIFQYLQPADLLSLSKASKSLRALLLDRSTAYPVWKFAFESVDPAPPACPDDLNLPQYANLLYTRTCHYCDSTRGLTHVWQYYVVICNHCFNEHFFCPGYSPEYGQISQILPAYRVYRKDRNGNYFSKTEWERHRKVWSRAGKLTPDYVCKEKKKLSPRCNKLNEFRSYESQQSRLKREDIDNRRGNRTDAIKEKVKELGYDDVLPSIRNWDGSLSLPHSKGVKPLTDREWEKIRPEIIAELDKKRTETRVKERRSLLQQRTMLLQPVYQYYISHNRSIASFSPTHLEVAKTQPFRAMIYDAPKNKSLKRSHFLAHIDKLPKILEAWRENTTNYLLGLIPEDPKPSKISVKGKKANGNANGKGKGKEKEITPSDPAVLDLATTLFGCHSCKAILPYLQALSHSCFRLSKNVPEKNPTLEESADPNSCWNETGIVKYHHVASECANSIITILGKDPKTATGEELDDARQRLECVRCRSHTPAGRPKRLVMDWRNAVAHEVLRHSSEEARAEEKEGDTKWEIVEGKRLLATYKREIQVDAPGKESWRTRWCIECALWTLNSDGSDVIRPNNGGWSTRSVPPGEDRCSSNHDMSMGTYRDAHPGFRFLNPYVVTL